MLAARRPYTSVIGVEISPALAQIARENVEAAKDARRVARDVRIVRADAARYAFPRGDLVAYLYNPFHGPVMEATLRALRAASATGTVVVLYHTPVERAALDALDGTELLTDLGFGLVYRIAGVRTG